MEFVYFLIKTSEGQLVTGARKSECHMSEAYADGKTGFDDTYKKVAFELLTHPSGE